MDILANAKRHLKEGKSDLQHLEVPEWGDDTGPAVIYYYPVMSCAEKSQVLTAHDKDPIDALVMTLILRARNEQGEKLFRPVQRQELRRSMDSNVLARVVEHIEGETIDIGEEEAAGNS